MPSVQQWFHTDLVSGEEATLTDAGTPPGWAVIDGEYHGPRGLFVIAQRLINQVIPGKATYGEVVSTPYDPASELDSGYEIPPGL